MPYPLTLEGLEAERKDLSALIAELEPRIERARSRIRMIDDAIGDRPVGDPEPSRRHIPIGGGAALGH